MLPNFPNTRFKLHLDYSKSFSTPSIRLLGFAFSFFFLVLTQQETGRGACMVLVLKKFELNRQQVAK